MLTLLTLALAQVITLALDAMFLWLERLTRPFASKCHATLIFIVAFIVTANNSLVFCSFDLHIIHVMKVLLCCRPSGSDVHCTKTGRLAMLPLRLCGPGP